jgi:hypothetical protein
MNALSLWNQAPPEVEAFTRFILDDAKASGVTVNVSPDTGLPYPNAQALACSGYFCAHPGTTPSLGVAVGGPWEDAFSVLVHEYAHLTQWRDQCPEWTHLFDEQGVEAADHIDRWLAGETYEPDTLKAWFRYARAIEMDAEKRVLAMIEAHHLPLDPAGYAQRANAYVLYYHQVEATRHWRTADELPPYRHPQVWPAAATTLGDPEVLPTPLKAAFQQVYGAWPAPAVNDTDTAARSRRRHP